MAPHVDFKHVRQHGSFEAVLAAYNIELIKDGSKPGQFKALCPFHEDTKPSLKVNTERNIFHCFACEAKGNILEFVRDMDGLADNEIRQAALKVAELSGIAPAADGSVKRHRSSRKSRATGKTSEGTASTRQSPPAAETPTDEALDGDPYNRVLTFELQVTRDDALNGWLEARGLDHHTVVDFGLGRASKRSKTIADRLAIPIHNANGELVAYCGRYVGNDVPDGEPKYKLPSNFRKDLEVFNLHRALANEPLVKQFKTLLVFESYFSVMRFHRQAPCVSFMGRSVSPQQIERLCEHAGNTIKRVVVVADGDEPGRHGARDIAGALAPHFWTRSLDLSDGEKPHHLEWDDLSDRLKRNW